jgi:hypothetical protein
MFPDKYLSLFLLTIPSGRFPLDFQPRFWQHGRTLNGMYGPKIGRQNQRGERWMFDPWQS